MSISFSGLGSGLPVSDWVEQLMAIERRPTDTLIENKSKIERSRSTFNTMEGKFSSLRSQIEKFTDGNITPSMDLFKKMLANSSNTSMATATANSTAVAQTIKLKIENLATSTKAQSLNSVAKSVDGTTLVKELANGTGTAGKFSMYLNGKKEEFTVSDTTTLNDLKDAINAKYSAANGYEDGIVTASIVDGKFSIDVDQTKVNSFNLGSSSDTSNFINAAQLVTTQVNVGTADAPVWKIDKAESDNKLSLVKTSGLLTSNQVNLNTTVTAGTFKIGNAEFTVDDNSTLVGIINKINSTSDAGVTAQFDSKSNKFSLTAKTPGQTTINIEQGTSNFLQAMGLVDAQGSIVEGSQTLGKNAKVYINDSAKAIEVNSNKLTEDVSGIPGVTINLLKVTQDAEKGTDSVDITIGRDNDSIVKSINDFLSKYNEINTEIDKQTAKDADLKGESGLLRIKSDLRLTMTNSVKGLTKYNSLGMIGISTGSVGTSVSATIKNFSLDESKLKDALSNNPDEVRALLLGDSKSGTKGLFQTLEEKVEATLNTDGGYFKTRKNSIDSTISSMAKTITQQEERLIKRRETITAQYTAMDKAIAQMKSQSGALSMIGI